jgi:hypothetical protein
MSLDEFDLFLTYLYLFGNKRVKYKLSFFSDFPDVQGVKLWPNRCDSTKNELSKKGFLDFSEKGEFT